MHGTNCIVVAPEYAGYGVYSHKRPTVEGIRRDVTAVYCHLRADTPYRVTVVGRSIGGAVGADFLARESCPPPRAFVTISTFKTLGAMGERTAGWVGKTLVPRRMYNTKKAVGHLTCPFLVIHGEADDFVPPQDGASLYAASAAANKRLELIPGDTHNAQDWPRIAAVICDFHRTC
jgi:pimeloyl-ACP methyl ester carboxylesterase